jgi:hypothetical protein
MIYDLTYTQKHRLALRIRTNSLTQLTREQIGRQNAVWKILMRTFHKQQHTRSRVIIQSEFGATMCDGLKNGRPTNMHGEVCMHLNREIGR